MPDSGANRCGYAAIVGRPNVGKSTLLNRMVGQKLSITSHRPQTTRHSLLGVKTLANGQILFVDTPGMHRRGSRAMNRYLNRAARASIRDIDVILFLVEALRWTDEDETVLRTVARESAPVFLVVNKVDRIADKQRLLPFLAEMAAKHAFSGVFPVSAKNGDNLGELQDAVLNALPVAPNFFPDDQVTDRSERFFAAEILREQLTRRYDEELPYSVTVEIEAFEESPNGHYRISAIVWVEREGQKAIIIGKQGAALKETARQARMQMESLFGTKVRLAVWVRVKKSWSSDEAALIRLGYGE